MHTVVALLSGAGVVMARVCAAHAGTTTVTKINERVCAFDREYHAKHPLVRRLPQRLFKREKRRMIIGDTVGRTMLSFISISIAMLEGYVRRVRVCNEYVRV
jgi:hypothetical protein